MTTPVHYRSTDPGAPVLDGLPGSLVTVLRACAIDGYGIGSDAKAPLGWESVFAENEKIAIRSADVNSTQAILRIDDTGTIGAGSASLRGYESMSDIDTGKNEFPPSSILDDYTRLLKSNTNDGFAREWELIGDERGFYFLVYNYGAEVGDYSLGWGMIWFGDLAGPTLPGDAANCALAAEYCLFRNGNCSSLCYATIPGANGNIYLPRSYDQMPGLNSMAVDAGIPTWNNNMAGKAGPDYPHPADGNLWVEGPMRVYEAGNGGILRGTMPGLYNPMHARPLGDREERIVFGRTLRAFNCYGDRQILIDMTGPWR